MPPIKTFNFLIAACLIGSLTACATSSRDQRDPLEGWNRNVHSFNESVDKYAIKPVAQGYHAVMPNFADIGVTNFFSNLNDIGVTINDFLQFKFKQGGMDGARFIVNSVAGLGGFIDVADKIDLPKHEEDFDQTLGYWGVPSGPYLVLPIFGPSSVRGVGGRIADSAMNPMFYIDNGIITGALSAVKFIDLRADLLTTEKIAKEASNDQYEFQKNSYLQRREYLIKDGNVAEPDITDIDEGNPKSNGSTK